MKIKKQFKGIILAVGTGSRLYPITKTISKQLLPVYDKPMIYYPLSTLMLAGINEILIITNEEYLSSYQALLGDGSKWGMRIVYKVQKSPNGIAEAFIIGEEFINGHPVALILGDNIFYGHNLSSLLSSAINNKSGATIFAYHVKDPERYGVVEFDDHKNVISIDEKPYKPKSNYALTGLYFYQNNVVNLVKKLTPSPRGELEITDLNKLYLKQNSLKVEILKRGYAWLDTGTHDSLLEASHFISTIEKRQGLKIACPEEIAFSNKWITKKQLLNLAADINNEDYLNYLKLFIN
jgi:glucose-1-phosphate thymidylyltransferase